jgi:hypothetical protein
MRTVPWAALAAFISVLSCVHAVAADKPKAQKALFTSDEVLSLTISGPISGISRKADAAPVPGTLKVEGAAPEELPITLATRGVTRRMSDICAFPPLRVEFSQKPGGDSIFKGQKGLKLVTHCQSATQYQQGVLLEYAAYRLYGALTKESFGVRLAQINYVGADGKPIITRLGFFIEDVDDVAKRNAQERLRGVNRIAPAQLDAESAARFAMFQYMISNFDWAMTASAPGEDCCHNSRLLAANGATTGLITVPYDFDYSGLVDAPYAVPPEGIHVSSVRDRRYRGFCQHNDQAAAIAADLTARRPALLAIVDQTPQLSDASRKKAAEYLGEFFDKISSPQKVTEVLANCLH